MDSSHHEKFSRRTSSIKSHHTSKALTSLEVFRGRVFLSFKKVTKSKSIGQRRMSSNELLSKVCDGFKSLKGSPRELWVAYTLKFLDSFSYFSFSVIMTLFLSHDFGFDDYWAGTIYGAWGALITLFGLTSGPIIDRLGVAASLRVGFLISFIAKCWIFITSSRINLLLAISLLSFGNCLGIPVLAVGVRRYTTDENRGFAFGLFYVIMNLAALLSGPTVDFCTIYYQNLKDGQGGDQQQNQRVLDENASEIEWTLSGYRLVVFLGIITNIVACLITLSVKEIKVSSPSSSSVSQSLTKSTQNREEEDNGGGGVNTRDPENSTQSFQPVKASTMEILRETINSPNFWRFLAVCMITLNIRMIFRHLDATLPKYMIREFGANVPKGTIYSINPALIMILVPLISAATTKVDPLIMIHHGCYVSAASVFFLVISTSITGCVLFVVVLSIGEAIWSPRLYDYTMQIAKEGHEGTYMALSSAPLFLAKLPVGMMSGYLLKKFCPEEGPRNSKLMWLIIGLTTASSPVLLTIFWGYISKRSDETISNINDNEEVLYEEVGVSSEMAPIHRRKIGKA